jgi:ERCC4-type nuclease
MKVIPKIDLSPKPWTLDDQYGGGSMEVIVDTREPLEYYDFLVGLFPQHKFIRQKLDEGDFESPRVLVERKEIGDLYGSIMGPRKGVPGRLPSQVERLSLHEERVVFLLVTGNLADQMRKMDRDVGIHINPEIIHGTLASLGCRERIHVMWVEDPWNALVEMVKFMQKVEEGKYMVPGKREPTTLLARYIGVTPKQAEMLMSMYPTMISLAGASAADLQRVPGIGKAKASTIISRLNDGWS